jgi:hypothetical protein
MDARIKSGHDSENAPTTAQDSGRNSYKWLLNQSRWAAEEISKGLAV